MNLFVWELRKLAGDAAARAGVVVLAAVLVAAVGAFAVPRDEAAPTMVSQIQRSGDVPVPPVFRKGLGFASLVLGPVASVFVPCVLLLVLAGTIAGEAETGTLAEAFVRPVPRWRLVAAKLAAGVAYALVLVGVAAVVAFVLAPLVLGYGKLLTSLSVKMSPVPGAGGQAPVLDVQSLEGASAFLRLGTAYAYVVIACLPVVGLAVLASAAAERARTAAVVSASVYFGLRTMHAVVGQPVKRFLVVGRMAAWRGLLEPEVEWGQVLSSAVVLVVAFAFLAGAAVLVFGGRSLPPRE